MNKFYQFYAKHTFLSIHLLILAFSAGFYFVGYITKDQSLYDLGYAIFVFDIFAFFIHKNQHGIYRYMTMNKDISHLPLKQIHLINTLFLIGFLLLSGCFIFLFVHLPYQNILKIIQYALLWLIENILRLIFHQKAPKATPAMPSESAAPFFTDTKVHHASLFAKILDGLFYLITILVLLAVVFWILISIYKKLTTFHGFSDLETREFLLPEMEHTKLHSKSSREKLHFFDRSTNGQIRKLYYRTIRKHAAKRKFIAKSMTPSQIESYVGLPESENLTLLHTSYEKARYGYENCSKTDVNHTKNGAANL